MSKKSNKKYSSIHEKGGLSIGSKSTSNKFAVLDMSDTESVESVVSEHVADDIKPVSVEKSESILKPAVVEDDPIIKRADRVDKFVYDKSKNRIGRFKKDDNVEFVPKKLFAEKSKEYDDSEWQTLKPIKPKKTLEKETDDREDRSVNKQLYIDEESIKEDDILGNKLYLNSNWTVWRHASDCDEWTEDSYTNIYVINSLGSFWRFFNNFHLLDKMKNQLFIMRGKIKPIWEDNENRKGGICSIKLDCFNKQGKIDMGTDVMICVCLLVMNETFLTNNSEINGISYSIKNKSILIKLWCKNYNNDITGKIPISFFNKLDTILRNMDKHSFGKRPENKISIRYTQIKPEYDVET